MKTVLDLSNKEIRQKAAEKIERQGKSVNCYQDDRTGACCMLGSLRLVIFGRTDIWNVIEDRPTDEMVLRYKAIVGEVAKDLPQDFFPERDEQLRIGKFNDANDKETVVRVLAGGE